MTTAVSAMPVASDFGGIREPSPPTGNRPDADKDNPTPRKTRVVVTRNGGKATERERERERGGEKKNLFYIGRLTFEEGLDQLVGSWKSIQSKSIDFGKKMVNLICHDFSKI